ncbi:hypothetical protein C8R44DRAFT_890158 [Mycena epipterygia]|nr:hypothetical protein C8R44DRAFT_890158 [Mycena epipterygia]
MACPTSHMQPKSQRRLAIVSHGAIYQPHMAKLALLASRGLPTTSSPTTLGRRNVAAVPSLPTEAYLLCPPLLRLVAGTSPPRHRFPRCDPPAAYGQIRTFDFKRLIYSALPCCAWSPERRRRAIASHGAIHQRHMAKLALLASSYLAFG